MADRRGSRTRSALTSPIPPRRIRILAREIGALRRQRKVDIVALVYSLVLGFAPHRPGATGKMTMDRPRP
jgi:hypothetical protein